MKKKDFKRWCYEKSILEGCNKNEIWDYFAPHLKGEFPELIMREYLRDEVFGTGNKKPEWIDEFIGILKRLWNGEHCTDCDWDVDEVEGSEDMLVRACKKHEVCLTCGGSGVNHYNESFPYRPCPDCTEKHYIRHGSPVTWPDQRKGQQRVVMRRNSDRRSG